MEKREKNGHFEGFALLGEADEKQLYNFISYYEEYVNITTRPIMEAHKYLEIKLSDKELENDPGTKFMQTRYHMAYWNFLKEDLEKVVEMWQTYERLRQRNPDDYPKKNADAFFC